MIFRIIPLLKIVYLEILKFDTNTVFLNMKFITIYKLKDFILLWLN
jgi:hypothetical protein